MNAHDPSLAKALPLTLDRLREVLRYEPETGFFFRLIATNNRMKVGEQAGSRNKNGYVHIMIDGRQYKAHRLAWFYVHGEWPAHQIDHRYGQRDDNRIVKLRRATNAQNRANAKLQCNNTSGFKGVSWSKERKKWKATIREQRKACHLGYFARAEDAHQAYVNAANEYFGDFARAE